jgi:hypothetical protein
MEIIYKICLELECHGYQTKNYWEVPQFPMEIIYNYVWNLIAMLSHKKLSYGLYKN